MSSERESSDNDEARLETQPPTQILPTTVIFSASPPDDLSDNNDDDNDDNDDSYDCS